MTEPTLSDDHYEHVTQPCGDCMAESKRLAIIAAVVGVIGGGFAAYLILKAT